MPMSLLLLNFIRKIKSPFNYNIGFIEITPEELINNKALIQTKTHWLKHPYKDRWFADPFILNVENDYIEVLVEEKEVSTPGILVKLKVSREHYKLLERIPILSLKTHLSYPAFIKFEGKVFVYPENGKSGVFNLYEYTKDGLKFKSTLIDAPLADSTIFYDNNTDLYYLIATNEKVDVHNNLQLYKSNNLFSGWVLVSDDSVVNDKRFARPGGNFFSVNGRVYRPAQDCEGLYGNSLHIREILSFEPYKEKEVFQLKPSSFRYSKGLHTLNFHNAGLAVIDGNGYYYPLLGRFLSPVINMFRKFLK